MSTKPLGRCGRAVEARDGMLHVEAADGRTMCGRLIQSYPLHWDTTTVVACGSCLLTAGLQPIESHYSAGESSQEGDA